MRRWLPEIGVVLLFFILPMILFWPVTLGGKTIVPADNLYQYEPWASARESMGVADIPQNALLSDLVLQNYQWKVFIRENLAEGELPLWQPNQFAGTTFFANGQHSMLYPFSVIFYILPLHNAYGWFLVSQLWLAGLFMYIFLRGIGFTRTPAFLGSITLELSSFFVVSLVHPMIQAGAVWLPLLLLMIELVLQRRPFLMSQRPATLPWVVIGGIALGMVHFAGHLEIAYYTLLVMAYYAAMRLALHWWHHRSEWRLVIQQGLLLCFMVALGFGIGAVQFITGFEAAQESFRTERESSSYETVTDYALPPRHVAKFLLPNIYGNPSHHSYIDAFSLESVSIRDSWLQYDPNLKYPPTTTDFGLKNYVEGGAYIGILPLLLAVIGIFSALAEWSKHTQQSGPPYRFIFLSLAAIAATFMFGLPTYAILYYGLPGVNQLHTPFRWIWPFTVCLAVFVAYGVMSLQQRHYQRAFRIAGIFVMLTGVVVATALLISRLMFTTMRPIIEEVYRGLAQASFAFVDVEGFYSYELANFTIFALLCIFSGIIIILSQQQKERQWRGIAVWVILGSAIISVDMFIAHWSFYPRSEPTWLTYTPPSIQWLQDKMRDEGPFRIQAYSWEEDPLHANAGWSYGLHDLRGYDSLFSANYAELMAKIAPQDQLDFNRIAPIGWDNPTALANPILDLLNVQYIITDWLIRPEDDPTALGYEEVYVDAGVRIYRNINALPRAYTVPLPQNGSRYEAGEGCDTPIQPQNPNDLKYIPPLSGTCIEAQAATIVQYSDIEVIVDANVDQPSWLILADNYADGWRAFIKPKDAPEDDEQEIEILRVNGNLRGIRLESGDWTIRYRYSPRSFQLGAFLSFVSGMLAIFVMMVWAWQTFVSPTVAQDDSRRLIKNSLAPIVLNLFNRGIDFAFAFIMLRILGPNDAGIYYYAIVVFGWFDIFTNFGLNTLLTRDVARDKNAAGRYLFNTSILRLALAALGIPMLFAVLGVRNLTVNPSLDSTAIVAIILLYIGLVPNSISTGLTALFYAFEQAEYPAAMTTVSTLVKVSLGLGALLLGAGVVGLAAASILTNFVTLALLMGLAWPLVRNNWQPAVDRQLQRTMLREAWPLMINHLLATIFFKSDVILMEAINGNEIVGVYSTAYKWLDALNIIPAFFTMALLPLMARQALQEREKLRKNYLLSLKLLLLIAIPTAVLTTSLAYFLIGFLGGPEFLPNGAIALQIMIWSIPIGWMNSLTQYVLIALDRQRRITGAFIVAVSFNVVGNLIFLPLYSFRAAAVTTILSEMILFIGFWWLMRDVIGGIRWLSAFIPIISAGALMLLSAYWLWKLSPLGALLASPIVYIGVLLVLNPFNQEETNRLSSLLPTPIKRLIFRQAMIG